MGTKETLGSKIDSYSLNVLDKETYFLNVEDVKQFIKDLKDLFDETRQDERYFKLFKAIDTLAGEDLI